MLRTTLGSRDPMEELESMPEALNRAVARLTAEQEAPGKWSTRQVMQHLADSELVGGSRCRMVVAHDAPQLRGYDHDLWSERRRYRLRQPRFPHLPR